jgi:predicted AlkP superfamily pyrophosphatase or phosphodiesterase
MKKITLLVFYVAFINYCFAQKKITPQENSPKPKLVVGIMIDQMRWDFLYRYADRYSNNGFKRLMNDGFNCENTYIPYAQSVTAVGHSTVYTGTTPTVHGIFSNEWYDRSSKKNIYCTEDSTVSILGGSSKSEPMSPKNLWATTICDELRLATNFRSKTIGISIKDRGGILPAGHSANAAYWYDGNNGNWISSTYYMKDLPKWVNDFNAQKVVDNYYKNNWSTLYPINTYVQSSSDNKIYEGKFSHEKEPVFPHELQSKIGKDYGTIRSTPYGNSLTLSFAKQALLNEKLGKNSTTDFLALSLSSPDYIGHQFGPNSIEIEDTYLRLDLEIASFLQFLDKEIGKGNYVVFLTADHGVAHVPGFLQENKIPAGNSIKTTSVLLNKLVFEKFKVNNIIENISNYQVYLNYNTIDSAHLDIDIIKSFIIKKLKEDENLLTAFDTKEISEENLPIEIKEKFIKGFNSKYSGDIQFVLKSGFFGGGRTGTTHGTWNPYDARIPLLFYGWKIKKGNTKERKLMTDIAPTIAALLNIQEPNGSIGNVITELFK